jgi:N-acetylglucosaminyl-diphospho-decaprenol L-rhamnosyltransferase
VNPASEHDEAHNHRPSRDGSSTVSTVDVVIVTYESRMDLPACLDSLSGVEGARVVVVEHGRDGSADLARQAGVKVIEQPSNPGFGAGQNRGALEGSAPAILVCNPDSVVQPAGIQAGLALLADQPDVGAVGGVVEDLATGEPEHSHSSDLGPVHLWGRLLRLRVLAGLRPVQSLTLRIPTVADYVDRVPTRPLDVNLLSAALLLVRRQAWEEVGGFDEGYFLYGEDLDLSRRLRGVGWRLVATPEVWGGHRAGSSLPQRWRHELEWWRGTLRYEARWCERRQWPWVVLAAVGCAVELSARRPRSAKAVWRGLLREPLQVRRLAAAQ